MWMTTGGMGISTRLSEKWQTLESIPTSKASSQPGDIQSNTVFQESLQTLICRMTTGGMGFCTRFSEKLPKPLRVFLLAEEVLS
jgi:hypothetical protein